MLVYEKKVDGTRHLFGTVNGTIPSNDDVQLTYKDAEGSTLTLSESDTYLDNKHGGIIRKSDGKDVNVFIGDVEIIGGEITPPVEAIGIEITTMPTKTAYADGEALDLTGLVVSVLYNNDTKEAITSDAYETSPVDGAVLTTDPSGKVTVTVSAFDFEASFDVTVS